MRENQPSTLPNLWQKTCKIILPLFWILGLLSGMVLAAGTGDTFFLTMRGDHYSAVSISGLILIAVLPFLFSAIAVYLSSPWLLTLFVFCKAATFGCCAWWFTAAYGGASWLIRALTMFTDLFALPLLMWFWLRHGGMSRQGIGRDLLICLAVVVSLGLLDILAVTPFAALLL